MGILNGSGENLFKPNEPITKAEYAVILYRALENDKLTSVVVISEVDNFVENLLGIAAGEITQSGTALNTDENETLTLSVKKYDSNDLDIPEIYEENYVVLDINLEGSESGSITELDMPVTITMPVPKIFIDTEITLQEE